MNLINYKKENGIGIIEINRPKYLNSINKNVLLELKSILSKINNDKNIKVIILAGSTKKAFVAGADIKEMYKMNPLEAKEFSQLAYNTFKLIERSPKPVIAAINGYALGGGCELALACDIRIASKSSKFGQPEVKLGIIPGFGGTQRLVKIVGMAKAKEMILTGKIIDAFEAKNIGLVNMIVDNDKLMKEALALAEKISENSPIAISLAKEVINIAVEDIEKNLLFENNIFSLCFSTNDQAEGMEAFIQKRKAKFSGE